MVSWSRYYCTSGGTLSLFLNYYILTFTVPRLNETVISGPVDYLYVYIYS